ncbi:corticotropin-releasing factor-binding protein [Schistocerca cancellata]|uniref:corticotropin-releasing factor-binding protein n=1 Tax=Schistocerca cancellata TaxID=274614 RepID=UPI0021197F77|nr:corticotropin-releasing factor-binding protein [Schistocerca cancellata]
MRVRTVALLSLLLALLQVCRGQPAQQPTPTGSLAALVSALPSANGGPDGDSPASLTRDKRSPYHIIKDCVTVTSEGGQFFYKAGPPPPPPHGVLTPGAAPEVPVCGVYLLADPDRAIEVHFDFLDVPCETGGLVSFVDGWELNRQFFPSLEDHPKPLELRYREFCGTRKVKEVFRSSQNAALIQYRVPQRDKGFSFTVRFIKNPTPCNILLEGVSDVYTLRNYGRRVNCTLSTLFPASLKVLSLSVGLAGAGSKRSASGLAAASGAAAPPPPLGAGSGLLEIETGTIHRCENRGMPDYVQLGGSEGLDTAALNVADSICGMDSKPGSTEETIFCGVTAVRLVSSGDFDNAVTVSVRQAAEDDIPAATLVCGL